ncbi:MAG: vitamin K epoxide reductase family protein [Fimbriimonadaceae bacterium]|nr:vitamin K epoxide reductase family protein [Fimbriimonadaceae bacterium]
MKSVMWNRVSVVLASLGVFVAGVLSYEKIASIELQCGPSGGCATVSASPLSAWFGIPVAYFGLAAYVAFLVLGILRGAATGEKWRQWTKIGFCLTAIGFGGSIYLSYVALAVIGATCLWCLASALLMTAIFIVHTLLITQEPPEETDRVVNLWALVGGVAALLFAIGVGATSVAKTPGIQEISETQLAQIDMSQFQADPRKAKGDENAKVTLLEFLDVNCPPCRRSYPKVTDVFEEHGGRLRVAYRHQPNPQIEGHETSMVAAIILEYAAKEGKFWEVLDAYMDPDNVNSIKAKNGLQLIATSAGMSASAVEEALGDPQGEEIDVVSNDMIFASEMGSQGTPTFVLVAEGQPPRFVTIEKLPEVLRNEPYRSLLR